MRGIFNCCGYLIVVLLVIFSISSCVAETSSSESDDDDNRDYVQEVDDRNRWIREQRKQEQHDKLNDYIRENKDEFGLD